MKILTIDFETYYAQDYSLSKKDSSTESYINDEKFETIGVAVKDGENEAKWCSGGHKETKAFLAQYDWANSMAVAHNAMFDMSILNWRYGIKPKLIIDTLSMARAVHGTEVGGSLAKLAKYYRLGVKGTEVVDAKGKRREMFSEEELASYGQYCVNDVELTYALFMKLAPHFNRSEIALIDMTIRMHSEPQFELDSDALKNHLVDIQTKKQDLLAAALVEKDIFMSNPKFAGLLQDAGIKPPTKISPTTGKETYAFAKTDAGFKALLEHDNPMVQAWAAARMGLKSTLEETRTERFIRIAESSGMMPMPLKYYGAMTGRWAACVVADTRILVYDPTEGVLEKRIVDVLADDLVWDGDSFVPHEGVVFNGYAEVISWDGITGTKDHVVFTEVGPISLLAAMQGHHGITISPSISEDAVDSARTLTGSYKR